MKKLKPILLAAAALGGLALMASAALLDLPGGITGLMCGLAAVIYASRMTAVAASNAGLNFEMDAIAAVETDANDRPASDVVIARITVDTRGVEYVAEKIEQ